MTAEWQAAADSTAKSADDEGKSRSAFFRMIASEHREMFGKSARLAAAVSTFGDMPLVVIASGKPNPAFGEAAGKFQEFWIDQSRTLADESTHGRFILAEGASHFLYVDASEMVAETVISIVDEVRTK